MYCQAVALLQSLIANGIFAAFQNKMLMGIIKAEIIQEV